MATVKAMSVKQENLQQTIARLQDEERSTPTGRKREFLRYAAMEMKKARERASRKPGQSHMGWPIDVLSGYGGKPYQRSKE